LEVAICVFLFEDKTSGLLDINKESAGSSAALLVVRHSAWPEVPIVFEYGTLRSMSG
jgi:hypothetical protein